MQVIKLAGVDTYNGGKNGNGTYQSLINHVPELDLFISLYAGNCGLYQNIKPALYSVINDIDPGIYTLWVDAIAEIGYNKRATVTNLNALDVLRVKKINNIDIDINKAFIYLDPPYLFESRKSQQRLYKHELNRNDHIDLLTEVLKFKNAKIMISHYAHPLYNEALYGWHTHDYQSVTRAGLVTERIYMNYSKPTLLHDYSYIGQDFREREKLKRIKTNLLRKLDYLEPVLRNSILSDLLSHYNAM